MNILVVGSGLAGATAARVLAEKGHDVTVKEARSHIAGNCHDYRENEILIHKYGPHIFHTNSDLVWNFLSRFTQWHQYYHQVTGQIQGQFVPVPFNFSAIDMLYPRADADRLKASLIAEFGFGQSTSIHDLLACDNNELQKLGEFVYQNVFKGYTEKQWGEYAVDLNKSVLARVPINCSYDNRYFKDKYQGIPDQGYTKMVDEILHHPRISISVDSSVRPEEILSDDHNYVVYTGPIDELYDYCFGALPYRSLRFQRQDYPYHRYPTAQTNFPNDYSFTRVTDMAMFPNFSQNNKSALYFEYPEEWEKGVNERYYPVPSREAKELYKKYLSKSKERQNLILCGRLAEYQYFNMDQAVANAMKKVDKIL